MIKFKKKPLYCKLCTILNSINVYPRTPISLKPLCALATPSPSLTASPPSSRGMSLIIFKHYRTAR